MIGNFCIPLSSNVLHVGEVYWKQLDRKNGHNYFPLTGKEILPLRITGKKQLIPLPFVSAVPTVTFQFRESIKLMQFKSEWIEIKGLWMQNLCKLQICDVELMKMYVDGTFFVVKSKNPLERIRQLLKAIQTSPTLQNSSKNFVAQVSTSWGIVNKHFMSIADKEFMLLALVGHPLRHPFSSYFTNENFIC